MQKSATNILKGADVRLEGTFHLDVPPAGRPPQARNAASAVPQVRVAENHPDHAVLEITCSCGNKSYVRCQYNNISPAEDPSARPQTNQENKNAD